MDKKPVPKVDSKADVKVEPRSDKTSKKKKAEEEKWKEQAKEAQQAMQGPKVKDMYEVKEILGKYVVNSVVM